MTETEQEFHEEKWKQILKFKIFIYATVIMFLQGSKEVTAVYKPSSKKSLPKKRNFPPLLLLMLLSWQW